MLCGRVFPSHFRGRDVLVGRFIGIPALRFGVPQSIAPGEVLPVRVHLPVISVGAVAVLMGLALGIGLGASHEHPQSESGSADPSPEDGPEHRQSGGDLPPMDFEGRVPPPTSSARPSKASTTTTPTSAADTSTPAASEPQRVEEVPSAIGVTPTPQLPTLPSFSEVTASSLVEAPSSLVPTGT